MPASFSNQLLMI